jgi:hypothetical protein
VPRHAAVDCYRRLHRCVHPSHGLVTVYPNTIKGANCQYQRQCHIMLFVLQSSGVSQFLSCAYPSPHVRGCCEGPASCGLCTMVPSSHSALWHALVSCDSDVKGCILDPLLSHISSSSSALSLPRRLAALAGTLPGILVSFCFFSLFLLLVGMDSIVPI